MWTWHLADGHRTLRLNLWDFGGQDIYHATHQFFLSHNAVYVLVADTRRDDTDFYGWLHIVEKLGGGSPVLLVKNEVDDRAFNVDEDRLRGRFANLKEVIAANLAGTRGRERIIQAVRYHVGQLEHIGQAYPRTWLAVRKILEARPEPYAESGALPGFRYASSGLQSAKAG